MTNGNHTQLPFPEPCMLTILQTRFRKIELETFCVLLTVSEMADLSQNRSAYFNVSWADSNCTIQLWRTLPLPCKTQKECSSHCLPQVYLTILKTSLWSEYFPLSTQANKNHLRKLCKKKKVSQETMVTQYILWCSIND